MTNTQKLIGYLSKKLDSVYQIYASFENNLIENTISLTNSGLSEKDVSVHSFWGEISKFKIGILRSCVQSDSNSVCKTKTPL